MRESESKESCPVLQGSSSDLKEKLSFMMENLRKVKKKVMERKNGQMGSSIKVGFQMGQTTDLESGK